MPKFFWTPHSGYHWRGTAGRFFEGWYFRLTLPEVAETAAFMYSMDDPAGQSALSGGAAQILGPGDQYLYCPLPQVQQFWAWPHRLGLGHWGQAQEPTARYLPPEQFAAIVQRGYQVTATEHQGCLTDVETGAIARWHYTVEPRYGWGPPTAPALPTTGWLSYLPIFEPGWQVLMAHGLATGWLEWQGRRYSFQQAPTYAEKNWGGAFPERWFWMQCNAFPTAPDVSLTAVGAQRAVLGQPETVGIMGIHTGDRLIQLSSLQSRVCWQVTPWETWQMTGYDHRYRVQVRGWTDRSPTTVRVPTQTGLQLACWDTTHGQLTLQVWQRFPDQSETLLFQLESSLAALEVGGQGWSQPWQRS